MSALVMEWMSSTVSLAKSAARRSMSGFRAVLYAGERGSGLPSLITTEERTFSFARRATESSGFFRLRMKYPSAFTNFQAAHEFAPPSFEET